MNSLRVLLVDRDADESERVAGRLEQSDHTVLPASGLDEAAQAIEIQRFDAVVVSSKLVSEELSVFRRNLNNSANAGKAAPQIPLLCYAAALSDQPSEAELVRYQVDACLPPDFDGPAFSQFISSLAAQILSRQVVSVDPDRPALPIFQATEFQAQLDFDRDLIEEILDLFFADSQRQRTDMQAALVSSNLSGLSRIAHSIKGSLGSLQAPEAAARAQALEEVAKAGDAATSAAALAGLESALKTLEPELLQLRHAQPNS